MSNPQQLRDKLAQSLEGVLDQPNVTTEVDDFSRLFLVVVSRSFEGMDEGERQAKVWDRILDTFDQVDQDQIGFVYTDAPSEI